MKKLIPFIVLVAVSVFVLSFRNAAAGSGKINLTFQHFVGDKLMELDTVKYKNDLGQSFTVTKFKYYIGKIHLLKAEGEAVKLQDYYLVNEDEENSKAVTLSNIPQGQYTGMSFLVGVDSADNCSGAQAGALDPVNAMFWAWNTGYIFLKLEGKSPVSTSPGKIFEYHIGGYKSPANCIRRVSVAFSKPLIVTGDQTNEVTIKADAAEVLKTPNTIDISKLSSVTDFHNAPMVADNYMDMFSVISVH